MSNRTLKEEIIRNMELEAKNKKMKLSKILEKEHAMEEYAIEVLKGLVFRQLKSKNSFDQVEYECHSIPHSKKMRLDNPHIKCKLPDIYFQISNYTEFHSFAGNGCYEHLHWDDENVTGHYFTATINSVKRIVTVIYDELRKENVLFAIEERGRNGSLLSYRPLDCDELLKMAKKSAKIHPYNFLGQVEILLYLSE